MKRSKSIHLPSTNGSSVYVPDSASSAVSSLDNAIVTPAILAESNGTNLKNANNLGSDFFTHVNDLDHKPISITSDLTSGMQKKFDMWTEKNGRSSNGMSPWLLCTSNGFRMRLSEEVLESPADLNRCAIILAEKASGKNVKFDRNDSGINKSVATIYVKSKSK